MKKTFLQLSLFLLLSFLFVDEAKALTPIARTDVVPYQRIDHNTTFNFGVVAFSKPGIEKVEFLIKGQGYSGGIKTSSKMALNTRVASAEYNGVWEYWVPISASEFSGNGLITVQPTVYDSEGNVRVLKATPLIVEGAYADFARVEAWVDPLVSDGSGSAGDPMDPFPSVQSAVTAAQVANGGTSSGNIIYLAEGVYDNFGSLSANTSEEWLTITKKPSANREKVVILNSGKGTLYGINNIKFESVTLQSACENCRVVNANYLWTNSCRKIGAGRRVPNSNPIMINKQSDLEDDFDGYYSTDDYTYDVNYAYRSTDLIRGAVVEKVHDDVFENFQFVINTKVTDLNNGAEYGKVPEEGATAAHSDVLQVYNNNPDTIPVENRIAYNIYATDIHCEGIMRSSLYQPARNNAFVNVFIEMRELPTDGDASDGLGNGAKLVSGLIGTNDSESHLIFWHNSFPYTDTGFHNDIVDSSVYGNHFWALTRARYTDFEYPSTTEWAYNHYDYAYGITEDCETIPTRNTFRGWSCPRPVYLAMGTNYTTGKGVVDISDPSSPNFGYPVEGSPLIDGQPDSRIPVDALGNPRDSLPDIGALEYQKSTHTAYRSDVDGSGFVNTIDALLVLRKSLSLDMTDTKWQDSLFTGNVDCRGTTSTTDALLILRYSLNLDMNGTGWCE